MYFLQMPDLFLDINPGKMLSKREIIALYFNTTKRAFIRLPLQGIIIMYNYSAVTTDDCMVVRG